ncbi:hypothetical protein [Microbacterium aurantiacum]|uniref:hypothetical protein n=1 Tax=Microbacterium aurantiacum TaxID=162393 RepID=UPI000C80598B|nr:hypothetical protein [Microbacterium aurantiacum]
MSNPIPPIVPLPDGDPVDDEPFDEDLVTMEQDGETTLDPDIDDGLIDSATADRLAAGDAEDDDGL